MIKDTFLFFVGIIVGSMNAIAGGGMLLGFPAMLAMGLSPITANVTANVVLLPGQFASIYGYRRYIKKIPRYYAWLLIPCLLGGAIGAIILRHTSSNDFEQLVPGLIVFAVALFALQPLLHFHLHKHLKAPPRRKNHTTLIWIALAMFPTAIYGGFFGAGFGFIMLAFLGFTNLRDLHKMNAMKNIAGLCATFTALLLLLNTHYIDWHHGLVMAAGCGIGGFYGSKLAQRISSHYLRIFIIIVGLVAATYIAISNH